MRITRLLAAATCGVLLLAGTAFADYRPDQDVSVSVTVLPGVLPSTSGMGTGETTFALQEAAHETVTSETGQSVDHFYVWVYVNGEPVAAVDPLSPMDFE